MAHRFQQLLDLVGSFAIRLVLGAASTETVLTARRVQIEGVAA
jgi:hypothetical protein